MTAGRVTLNRAAVTETHRRFTVRAPVTMTRAAVTETHDRFTVTGRRFIVKYSTP